MRSTPRRAQVPHNGSMGFVPNHRAASASGVREGDHGPSSRSLEMAGLQGKCRRAGVRALWGQQWTRLLFFHDRSKYCHNGGTAFAHQFRQRLLPDAAREGGAFIPGYAA